jgi:hypothetical protein
MEEERAVVGGRLDVDREARVKVGEIAARTEPIEDLVTGALRAHYHLEAEAVARQNLIWKDPLSSPDVCSWEVLRVVVKVGP